MILVDSSVWIDFFKNANSKNPLSRLLELDLVCTNDIILSELLPILYHRNQTQLISGLLALKCQPLNIFWEGIIQLQTLNLKNGLSKVGLPDIIICQQCLSQNIEFLSFDKHFEIMAQYTRLKLFGY